MTRPNFLFIGPDKTGSSWLHRALDIHPDCYVPAAKDLYFFDRYYGRGLSWYESHFRRAGEATIVAEVCHDYILSSEALTRIEHTLVGVKLMCTVRDPVDRAWSQYLYALSLGARYSSFTHALSAWPALLENSRYGEQLDRVLATFARQRILVSDFGDLSVDPVSYARAIFTFLGVDPDAVEADQYRVHVRRSRGARSPRAARLGKAAAVHLRGAGRPDLVGHLKTNDLVQRLFFRGDRPATRPTPADREFIASALRRDIDRLDTIRGVDHRKAWGWDEWTPGAESSNERRS